MNSITSISPEILDAVITARFAGHPFEHIQRAELKELLRRYLAMSQAFPHLQAGAQQRLVFHYMDRNEPVPEDVETTFVVGGFLVWDEIGGWSRTRASGAAALPAILDTRAGFHANLLRADIVTILGEDLSPDFEPTTRHYLKALSDGLSSTDPVVRCAWMVSFESHAHTMIASLWDSIASLVDVPREALGYFATHVGGDDPAEAYHVEMTSRMIEKLVTEAERERFLELFARAYAVHYAWCEHLARGKEAA